MSFKVELISNELSFEVTDSHYNLYRIRLTKNDPFIMNYMSSDIKAHYDLIKSLKPNISFNENCAIIEYNKPINLKYKLQMVNKSNNDEKLNLILQKMFSFENEITELKNRATDLESQLENGVVLPGYNGGIIDINENVLMLNYFSHQLIMDPSPDGELKFTDNINYHITCIMNETNV